MIGAIPWAIVPVSPLGSGKSRLATVLDERQRAVLAGQLLGQTLGVLSQFPGPNRTIVVSADRRVLRQASTLGFGALAEDQPRDLNRALTAAAAVLPWVPVMIVPIDLPLVTAAHLRRVARRKPHDRSVIIATDHEGTGTNVMVIPNPFAVRFRYGSRSRQKHSAEAAASGYPVRIIRHPALAFDIDTPADLAHWSPAQL